VKTSKAMETRRERGAATRAKVTELQARGLTVAQISNEMGIDSRYVRVVLGQLGLKAAKTKRVFGSRADLSARGAATRAAIEAADKVGESDYQIARRLNLTREHVRNILDRLRGGKVKTPRVGGGLEDRAADALWRAARRASDDLLADLRRESAVPANLILRERSVVPVVAALSPPAGSSPAALCADLGG